MIKRSRSVDSDQGSGKKLRKEVKRPKKRKRRHSEAAPGSQTDCPTNTDVTSSARSGRLYTVSVALPGSIIDNAQSPELKTYLAGQIARAAAVFNVDEIVVFDELGTTGKATLGKHRNEPNIFLVRILQYLETPQYLRKALFPMHPDLKFVGLLNPLDCPHHMRMEEHSLYREGVVLDRPSGKKKKGSYADCGMRKNVLLDKSLKPGIRVTVKLHEPTKENPKHYSGEVISPNTPRVESGIYWGYTVRFAHSFGAVFTESPYEGGYDLTIGTSERGENINEFSDIPKFRHLLIVFGGLKGLEYSLECDESLRVNDVSLLFHHYLNTCPGQGSRTIRTEVVTFFPQHIAFQMPSFPTDCFIPGLVPPVFVQPCPLQLAAVTPVSRSLSCEQGLACSMQAGMDWE